MLYNYSIFWKTPMVSQSKGSRTKSIINIYSSKSAIRLMIN
ncbi:unnamed protein product [Schistosoma mattheei]|uniref:Uncharacterized protein n=1 Tax=Schistosoma mattheei TaxID=31246 RepID=A0A183PHM3_9TREM|nr:unnamed protein product [Schistosoma mattheei]